LKKSPLPRTDDIIFKIFSPKNWRKIGFLNKILLVFAKNGSKHCFLKKKKTRHFFLRKFATVAEYCDHNIDPLMFSNYIFQYHVFVSVDRKNIFSLTPGFRFWSCQWFRLWTRTPRTLKHRNLRSRTSMLAHVLQIFLGKEHLVKKLANHHPRQGNLLQRNNFSAVYKTYLHFTK
jgi:hypothetical protein